MKVCEPSVTREGEPLPRAYLTVSQAPSTALQNKRSPTGIIVYRAIGRRGGPMASLLEQAFRRYEFYNPGHLPDRGEGPPPDAGHPPAARSVRTRFRLT